MSDNSYTQREDARFEELFRPSNRKLVDEDFVEIIMRRINRQLWIRRAILFSALVAGILISFDEFNQTFILLSTDFMELTIHWKDVTWVDENRIPVLASLLALLCPGLLHWLVR